MKSKFKLFVAVITVILPVETVVAFDLVRSKRPKTMHKVQGCYSEFSSLFESIMGEDSSNVRCQDVCREKGFILAATHRGNICKCGNIYPTGSQVADNQCNSRCRYCTFCKLPCCGGDDVYTLSVVGDIDAAKQVLLRLSGIWRKNANYRNYMVSRMKKDSAFVEPKRHMVSWSTSTIDENNELGWNKCWNKTEYMSGLRRGSRTQDDGTDRIEASECNGGTYQGGVDCYDQNWSDPNGNTFSKGGWSTCKEGYFLKGIHRRNTFVAFAQSFLLSNIDKASCCRPIKAPKMWKNCYVKDVTSLFDKAGTQSCGGNHFMVGLYRSSCEKLYCLEKFKCCEIENWTENPNLSINIQTVNGNLKKCSIRAMDTTVSSESFQCKEIKDRGDMLELEAMSFTIEDKIPLNVVKPEPIAGFRPVTCTPRSNEYQCTKILETSIIKSTSFTIGTGLQMSVSIGTGVKVSTSYFSTSVALSFQMEVRATTSLNVGSSKSRPVTTTESTDVSVNVPANKQIRINMLRTLGNLVYKWKASFDVVGVYFATWPENGYEITQDVTAELTGGNRRIYAFGSWSYPGLDKIKVVVTDQYGDKTLAEGCDHDVREENKTKQKLREFENPSTCKLEVKSS